MLHGIVRVCAVFNEKYNNGDEGGYPLTESLQSESPLKKATMDMEKFFDRMRSHLKLQDRRHLEQLDLQDRRHQEQMRALTTLVEKSSAGSAATIGVNSTAIPNFSAFDSTTELWQDYLSRFSTFLKAHDVPETRKPQVFLTNQTATVYKLLANLAAQSSPSRRVNDLTMEEIEVFMTDQFDPNRFVVRERFKFLSEMKRRPSETIQELAARIRQDASTCDFPSITDPLDEALRTRFICSVSNEAVLKAQFKVKSDELKGCVVVCRSASLPKQS